MRVAIIGGGISGLSAAHFVRRRAAAVEITVYERSHRLGGWIQTDTWAAGNTPLVFERGPRTLRPVGYSGAATLKLIHDVGMEEDVLHVPKDSPAARNRLLLANDVIERLPTSAIEFARASLDRGSALHGAVPRMLWDLVMPINAWLRTNSRNDESVHAFMSRHFGTQFTETVFSAVVHGIHAADMRKLSMRAAFPLVHDAVEKSGSVLLGMAAAVRRRDAPLAELLRDAGPDFASAWARVQKNDSLVSIRGGLGRLVDRLACRLAQDSLPVRLELNTRVIDSTPNASGTISVSTQCGDATSSAEFDKVVFAAPPSAYHRAGPDIGVVNVAYAEGDVECKVARNAFGFLASERRGPLTDPDLLGIVFDTAAVPAAALAERGWLKLTVMMAASGPGPAPSCGELKARALHSIETHLGVPTTVKPAYARAYLHRGALPSYSINWNETASLSTLMAARSPAHTAALERGAYSSVGTWAAGGGVGVGDCVRGALDVARRIVP